jgi:hypothetical protein
MHRLSQWLGSLSNALVALAALGVGGAAFLLNLTLSAAARPPRTEILVAARRLPAGTVLSPSDLRPVAAYADPLTEGFVPAAEASRVAGKVLAVPLPAGAPLPRSALLDMAGSGRLAALLADRPGMILFPIDLSASHIIAPDPRRLRPGDRIALTVVIPQRPMGLEPTPSPPLPPGATPTPPRGGLPVPATPTAALEILARLQPPLAKDLFPDGLEVADVLGVPEEAPGEGEAGAASAFAPAGGILSRPLLLVLAPAERRELLALALSVGQPVVISLLGRPDPERPTPGLSFLDLEEWLRAQRQAALAEGPAPAPTPTPATGGTP